MGWAKNEHHHPDYWRDLLVYWFGHRGRIHVGHRRGDTETVFWEITTMKMSRWVAPDQHDIRVHRRCTNCIGRLEQIGGSSCLEHGKKCSDIDPVTCEFFSPIGCKTCIGASRDILKSGRDGGPICSLTEAKCFIGKIDRLPSWCPLIPISDLN